MVPTAKQVFELRRHKRWISGCYGAGSNVVELLQPPGSDGVKFPPCKLWIDNLIRSGVNRQVTSLEKSNLFIRSRRVSRSEGDHQGKNTGGKSPGKNYRGKIIGGNHRGVFT